MRTAFLRHQGDPHCKIVSAELTRDPVAAAAWSERYKTAGIWQTSERTLNDDPLRTETAANLSELASQLTALSSGLESGDDRHWGTPLRTTKAFHDLQESIRHNLAQLETSGSAKVDRVESVIQRIRSAAQRIPVVQFHCNGEDLIAFVHYRKQTHFHRFYDGARIAREFTSRWRFLIERAPFLTNAHLQSDLKDEQQLLGQGGWLLAPLEISPKHRRLLILPEGDITNLPWQAIMHNGRPLIADHEILLSPSLRHYLHARNHRTRSTRIEVFVGPTDDLPKGRKECGILLASEGGSVVMHSPCYRHDWPDRSQARLWHYAGHAQFRRDNPFYSSLLLADGPIFAADFRLKSSRVGLVTLAACRTGQQAYLPGEESTGLVRSLLEMGAHSVLASHWAISDESTSLWMTRFYELFLSGEPTLSAVRKTALSIQDRYASAYHWAAFSVFGAA
jgi:CHAT domain-containing protein